MDFPNYIQTQLAKRASVISIKESKQPMIHSGKMNIQAEICLKAVLGSECNNESRHTRLICKTNLYTKHLCTNTVQS